MASKKAKPITIGDKDYLTKSEAMAYTNRLSEATFDRDIAPYVHAVDSSKEMLYSNRELAAAIEEHIVFVPTKQRTEGKRVRRTTI